LTDALRRLHRRVFRHVLATAFPSAGVAAYVVPLTVDTGSLSFGALLGAALAPALAIASVQQWLVSRALLRAAFAERAGEPPAARLVRILELPRRIELFSNVLGWTVGGAVFGASLVLVEGVAAGTILATTGIGLVSSLFPGLILVSLLEELGDLSGQARGLSSGLQAVAGAYVLPRAAA